MKFISWALLGLVMAANTVQALTLAEAAAQMSK